MKVSYKWLKWAISNICLSGVCVCHRSDLQFTNVAPKTLLLLTSFLMMFNLLLSLYFLSKGCLINFEIKDLTGL